MIETRQIESAKVLNKYGKSEKGLNMDEKAFHKSVKTYTNMFADTLKKRGVQNGDKLVFQYSEKVKELFRSDLFEEYEKYPTIGREKLFGVIAMCLVLRKNGYSDEEIILFVRTAFGKLKKLVGTLEKVIDTLPNAYKIVEKWNLNDHESRVKDGSVRYDSFRVEDGRIEYSISKCMYVEAFAAYGIRELCKVFCESDTEGYANLPKHVDFYRYSDLSDGDACHDVITRK